MAIPSVCVVKQIRTEKLSESHTDTDVRTFIQWKNSLLVKKISCTRLYALHFQQKIYTYPQDHYISIDLHFLKIELIYSIQLKFSGNSR